MALSARSDVPRGVTGKPCSIGAVYEAVAHDPVELRELNVILYEEDNTQGQVFGYLSSGGYAIGVQSVNRHRGKGCRCFTQPPSKFCRNCLRDLPSCVCDAA